MYLAAVLLVVVVAGGTVAATLVSHGQAAPDGSRPTVPSTQPTTLPSTTMGGTIAPVAPTSSVTDGAVNDPSVTTMASLLEQSAAARSSVQQTVSSVQSCSFSPTEAQTAIQGAIQARQGVVSTLRQLPVGDLRDWSMLVADLTTVMEYSIAADQHFADWIGYVVATGCPGQAPHNGDYAAADAASTQATVAKQTFISEWNPIAARQGLRQYQQSDL